MFYEFTAIYDADMPQVIEPIFPQVLTTYTSEANKTVGHQCMAGGANSGKTCGPSRRPGRSSALSAG